MKPAIYFSMFFIGSLFCSCNGSSSSTQSSDTITTTPVKADTIEKTDNTSTPVQKDSSTNNSTTPPTTQPQQDKEATSSPDKTNTTSTNSEGKTGAQKANVKKYGSTKAGLNDTAMEAPKQ